MKQEAFIDDQRRLTALQIEKLATQEHFEQSHLYWRRLNDRMKGALQIMTVLVGLAVAGGLSVMVWNAAHSEGLIIEAFTVPPELTSRGLSGQAVASQLLDKLVAMQKVTAAARPAKTYANDWGGDLKVEIPSTGISFGEAWRFLRGWLGHETRISGEVYRTDNGIAVTVRTSGGAGATFTGPQAGLDALIQKAAEHVYGDTQPYGYASFLSLYADRLGMPVRPVEAEVIFRRLTANPNSQERAWAWIGLGDLYTIKGSFIAASAYYRNGIAAYPGLAVLHTRLANSENNIRRFESTLGALLAARRLLNRSAVPDLAPDTIPYNRIFTNSMIATMLGDFAEAEKQARLGTEMNDRMQRLVMVSLAYQHDRSGMLAYIRDLPPPPTSVDAQNRAFDRLHADFILEDWKRVLATESDAEKTITRLSKLTSPALYFSSGTRPWVALAKAKLGDIAGGQSLIDHTSADCYPCTRIRAQIAATAGQWERADYWFSRAVNGAPSLPFAEAEWGRALLARGQPDAAIEKFKLSNQKGPRFADPLECWGEALMAKNQSHRALAKFAEAEKYAPNWGRLHLKWGEAFIYAGKQDDAKKQFAIAAKLDLTPSEKQELGRHK